MSQTEHNQIPETSDTSKPCSCEKTTCMIGIASIAIGIGGFIIASLM